jgi:hypothetical protein
VTVLARVWLRERVHVHHVLLQPLAEGLALRHFRFDGGIVNDATPFGI